MSYAASMVEAKEPLERPSDVELVEPQGGMAAATNEAIEKKLRIDRE